MEIKISEIVTEKLAQMERDGIVQRKIEETLEKSILEAVTSELEGYSFKRAISQQVSQCISEVAANCGFSAYNGFIAERVKAVIQDMYTDDISRKLQTALDDVMLKHHENVKLSDIFRAYREWVLKNTEETEKYERREFTCQLRERERGDFAHYTCTFADRPVEDIFSSHDRGDIILELYTYRHGEMTPIGNVYLNGRDISESLRIGNLTEFEAFVVNLYYNKTQIIMDLENVDEDSSFDIDC